MIVSVRLTVEQEILVNFMAEVLFIIDIAKPFLKWAGGKGQLLPEIKRRLPKELKNGQIDTYIEPFVGGGAVFFFVAQHYENLKHFYLFDVNEDLINCYKALANDLQKVILELRKIAEVFLPMTNSERKGFYLEIRDKFNEEKASKFGPTTAAELIFLNKTCFNGLYRVNRNNQFNVPFGDYNPPKICDAENLQAVSQILKEAKIVCGNFEACEKYVDSTTFVYLDPPYRPISKTASFTSYSKDSFSEKDQIRLAEFCQRINKKGGYFLLSNSDPKNEDESDDFFERHYNNPEFTINRVKASRAINCKASGRGKINELLITNY
jgi:DNA adenine methylase